MLSHIASHALQRVPITVMGVLLLTFITTLSGAATEPVPDDTNGDQSLPPWVLHHRQDMLAARTFYQHAPRGAVTLVYGNDVFQIGKRFTAGDNWLALACSGSTCRLQPASLAVKAESVKEDDVTIPGQRLTFTTSSAHPESTVYAWFKRSDAVNWLATGLLKTWLVESDIMQNAQAATSQLGGSAEVTVPTELQGDARLVPMLYTAQHSAELYGWLQGEDESAWPAVYLQLRAQGQRQLLLGRLATCEGLVKRSYLLWAGDLDHDGRADFLISFIDASGPVHLYLSSLAQPSQLVGLAGVYNSPDDVGECEENALSVFG
jgi:hypothetical protein